MESFKGLNIHIVYIYIYIYTHTHIVAQSCLCDPMDCSLPGSFVHGILQARVQEWVAISFCNISIKVPFFMIDFFILLIGE